MINYLYYIKQIRILNKFIFLIKGFKSFNNFFCIFEMKINDVKR